MPGLRAASRRLLSLGAGWMLLAGCARERLKADGEASTTDAPAPGTSSGDATTGACGPACDPPSCGDGVLQDGEQCDAGAGNGPGRACRAGCVANVCGDGDQGPGEGCDDGNLAAGDGCTPACALPSCGDAALDDGEACDDGDDDDTDACTRACTLPTCGDAAVQQAEQCDHGHLNSDASACTLGCAAASCGDGLLHVAGEQCDDGGGNGPGQACRGDCTLNACGDGDRGPGEECDAGAANGDGAACHLDCKLDVCGDGLRGPTEECDDGNDGAADGCSAACDSVLLCEGKAYDCADGDDDDGDGLVDLDDPECTTPCDDSEESFQTLLPGQNIDCRWDCFWDANGGFGDDDCEHNVFCDLLDPGADIGCPYDPDFKNCDQLPTPMCLSVCPPRTPNGCDCFGCCRFGDQWLFLDSSDECRLDNLAGCHACTPTLECANPCEPDACELCIGQGVDALPEKCLGVPSCATGDACVDAHDCPAEHFCQTGCCVSVTL